jgi:hypothetical protein
VIDFASQRVAGRGGTECGYTVADVRPAKFSERTNDEASELLIISDSAREIDAVPVAAAAASRSIGPGGPAAKPRRERVSAG